MNIAEFSIKNKLLSVILILITLFAGWNAYLHMPRFEDPEFTIRTAIIFTQYPGASPEEVALEVSEPLETALQQMQEVKEIKSISSPGLSEITVEIKYEFSKTGEDLQVIWTKLRNKIKDAERTLPGEAGTPIVNDNFGDLYGFYYFVTGEDYTWAELRAYAKQLQKEILQVKGVGKVQLAGEQKEAIFVEISQGSRAALGASVSKLYDIIGQQNSVVSAGDIRIKDRRIMIDPSGAIDTVSSIEDLQVSTSPDGKITYLKDIATVYRGYQTPPTKIIRYNGKRAIALGISNVLGGNVVKTGKAVDQRIRETLSLRPIAMEVSEYYHQGRIVQASVDNFIMNVLAALAIVIVTLLIFMGLRSALIIGAILLLTIAGTLATMQAMDIPLHRISLGALIIALGMMVDNAIVVTEGILVGVRQKIKKLEIAKKIVSQTKWPLLGGTLVGIIAFAPIGFAPGQTAEYTGHLFWVVMISLMISWIFAITLTPLFCYWFLPEPEAGSGEFKEGAFARNYKQFIRFCLKIRWIMIAGALGLFAVSIWGAQFMTQGYFPQSTSPQMVVDYWLPESTAIERTRKDMVEIENFVRGLDGVEAVQTLIGGGGIRYMLIYSPQSNNSSYGQLLVRVDDYHTLDDKVEKVQSFIEGKFPEAQAKVWRFILGTGGGSKIEAQFSGKDPEILHKLADQAKAVMRADGGALSIKDDWRQPVAVIEPVYSAAKGRRAGISRRDLAVALDHYFTGQNVGVYREGDDQIPIISRLPDTYDATIDDIKNVQVLSSATGRYIPISQVTNGFKTIWRNGQILSKDRVFTIKAQSDPYPGKPASVLLSRIRPQIEAIELPDGYNLKWEGEYGDSTESNEDLMSTIPMGFLAMVLVVVILFRRIRQPLVIWLVVPLSMIGVVFGLVTTGVPLEFMGILGILSLSGLLIKNAIVLVDEIDVQIADGKPRFDAVVDAANSRMRPVMMGTLTTVLGVTPLFFDAFFQSMAVVIVFGLSFATLLTLLIIPLLYSIFMGITAKERAA